MNLLKIGRDSKVEWPFIKNSDNQNQLLRHSIYAPLDRHSSDLVFFGIKIGNMGMDLWHEV